MKKREILFIVLGTALFLIQITESRILHNRKKFFPRGFSSVDRSHQHKPIKYRSIEDKELDEGLSREYRAMDETTSAPLQISSTTSNFFDGLVDFQDNNALKTLIRREDEPQLNEIWNEMHKAQAQVDKETDEFHKAEEVARVTRRIFEDSIEKERGIAVEHVTASENAAKAATDALNAQKDLAQHDTLLSQARQTLDALSQKYLVLQAEILRKANTCNLRQEGQNQNQQQSSTSQSTTMSTPAPVTAAVTPPPAGVTPGVAKLKVNPAPQLVPFMPNLQTADQKKTIAGIAVP